MRKWSIRFGWMGVGIVALYVFTSLASVARGGPLDPPGPLSSTMKSLDDIPPSWHQILPANDGADACHSSRFQCVMQNDEGVLDRETGLVWERAPLATQQNWYSAQRRCREAQTGGRYGWRTPRIEELRSLLDASGALPSGVFQNGQTASYWSTTIDQADNVNAAFLMGASGNMLQLQKQEFQNLFAWCVRGGTYSDIRSDF